MHWREPGATGWRLAGEWSDDWDHAVVSNDRDGVPRNSTQEMDGWTVADDAGKDVVGGRRAGGALCVDKNLACGLRKTTCFTESCFRESEEDPLS